MVDVTICIPTIPPRTELLARAIRSVTRQTVQAGLSVVTDHEHQGAWWARNQAAKQAETEWIGFLDDDDTLFPHHVEHLLAVAREHDAQVVWGWFDIVGGIDPFPHYRGRQYDRSCAHVVPITYLIKRELFLATRGFQADVYGAWDLQDQPVLDDAYDLSNGALFASPEITWTWFHHGHNTSGLPTRW